MVSCTVKDTFFPWFFFLNDSNQWVKAVYVRDRILLRIMHAHKKNKHKFYWPSHSSHTRGSGLVEQHLAAQTDLTATGLIWFHYTTAQQFGDSDPPDGFSSQHSFPSIMFCVHAHVKPPHWRHEVCNQKHSSAISPLFISCVFSLVFCLAVSLLFPLSVLNVSFSAALNIFSTHDPWASPSLCSNTLFFCGDFYLHAYVSLHLSPILTSNRPPVCVFIRPPPRPPSTSIEWRNVRRIALRRRRRKRKRRLLWLSLIRMSRRGLMRPPPGILGCSGNIEMK